MAKVRWSWLLAALLWSFPVRAEKPAAPGTAPAGVPLDAATKPRRLFEVPAAIPAGGVLPIYGACFDASSCASLVVTVRDGPTQSEVAGHVEIVQDDVSPTWLYFEPDVPFAEGTRVVVTATSTASSASVSVEVAAAAPLSASSVLVDASISKTRNVLRKECCPTIDEIGRQRCLDVSVRAGISVVAALQFVEPIATQYLFELTVRDLDGVLALRSEFGPLAGSLGALSVMGEYDGSTPTYCYAVRAKPLAGGAVVDLIADCVDNTLTGFGKVERAPSEVEQWLATCEMPTVPQGDAAETDETDQAGSDGGVAQREADVRAGDGCQLARFAPATPALASLGSLVTLLLLLGTRRRARGRLQSRTVRPR